MLNNITDTHVHVWDLKRVKYDWLEGDTSILNNTYLIATLTPQIKQANVSKGILVQAANNLDDTSLMLEEAEKNEWIKGVVGWLPLTNPDATYRLLQENYTVNPYLKGARHLIHNEPDDAWLLQDTVLESLSLLASFGLPFDIVGVNTFHIETALKVAEKIPNLKMVFDHLNNPPIASKEKFGLWGTLMKEAATHPNLYAKISGLGTASGNFSAWTTGDLEPYVSFVVEHFSSNRCFCGGDWPVSLLAGSYAHTWQAYHEILKGLLNETDLEKVLATNAGLFYQL